jgi:hypothetical protein
MTEDDSRVFLVVGKSRASAIFSPGHRIVVTGLPGGEVFTFETRYLEKGFETRIPDTLWVEIRGVSSTLVKAAETFGNRARNIAAVLGIAANASMGNIGVELAYEVTPGIIEREYFQSFMPEPPTLLVPNRRIPPDASMALHRGIEGHSGREPIMRAIAQYNGALDNWSFGSETLCVAHLFMGLEALKSTALDHHLLHSGLTEQQLAQAWGYMKANRKTLREFLIHETRRRILFDGDDESHRIAKSISDKFEHGFVNYGALRPEAINVVVKTARYLRSAVIRLSGVDDGIKQVLMSEPYDSPSGPLQLVKYIWGTLTAQTEQLPRDGQAYPICQWKSVVDKVSLDDQGRYTFRLNETITPLLGEGVKLRLDKHEVWDGSKLAEARKPKLEQS